MFLRFNFLILEFLAHRCDVEVSIVRDREYSRLWLNLQPCDLLLMNLRLREDLAGVALHSKDFT